MARPRRRLRPACFVRVVTVGAAIATIALSQNWRHIGQGSQEASVLSAAFSEVAGQARKSSPADVRPEEQSLTNEDWWESDFENHIEQVSPVEYQLHAGAGASHPGELHLNAAGRIAKGRWATPDEWQLEYQKRLPSLAPKLWGWHPSFRSSLAKRSYGASLRWSKALLREGKETQPDGTGLDVNLETAMQAPRDSKAEKEWEQRAEVVFGPRAQAKYLNFSLPVGIKVGTVISSKRQEGDSAENGVSSRAPTIYADISWPGLNELQGWLVEAQALHRRLGAWTGQMRRGWRSKEVPDPKTDWSLQHFQQYRPFRLPSFVGDSMASASSFLQGSFSRLLERSPYHQIPRPAPRPAVIPATKLRIGSGGPGALLGLQSAQSGLGGSGFDGVVEVSKLGWGAKMAVALGVADEGFGQPRYAITASGAWHNKTSILHELKWMLAEGQWAGITFQNGGPGRPPRINAAVELVR